MSQDIRKWFMKSHDKGNGSKPAPLTLPKQTAQPQPQPQPQEHKVPGGQESSRRRKTSKYFPSNKPPNPDNDDKEVVEAPPKRKAPVEATRSSPANKVQKVAHHDDDDDDDFVPQSKKKEATPSKKLKNASGVGISQSQNQASDDDEAKDAETPCKSGGRGHGGRGVSSSAAPAAGRGRGAGRGGFMNFGERKDPPHKGERDVPEGDPKCLAGLTFVISGTLDRTAFITEDGLFDKIRASIRASIRAKVPLKEEKKPVDSAREASLPNKSPKKVALKNCTSSSLATRVSQKQSPSDSSLPSRKEQTTLTWTEKYKPKVPNDIIGNQQLVKQLHDWLMHWHEQLFDTGVKKKGSKPNNSGAKKAVLLSGTPGIGKTTSAKLVSQMLGFQAIEVNASDSRGKADSKIVKGIDGSNANSVKELVNNESLSMDRENGILPDLEVGWERTQH